MLITTWLDKYKQIRQRAVQKLSNASARAWLRDIAVSPFQMLEYCRSRVDSLWRVRRMGESGSMPAKCGV